MNCLTLFYNIIWIYTKIYIYTFFSDSDIRNKISQIHCFFIKLEILYEGEPKRSYRPCKIKVFEIRDRY